MILIIFGEGYTLCSSSLHSLLHPPATSSPVGPHILFSSAPCSLLHHGFRDTVYIIMSPTETVFLIYYLIELKYVLNYCVTIVVMD